MSERERGGEGRLPKEHLGTDQLSTLRINTAHVPAHTSENKNLLMPLVLMGCFPVDFQEAKRPLRAKSVKRPIKVGKRPINEGKRPIKAMVLVGISVGCLTGCFRAPPPWQKTAPLKRPIQRSTKRTTWGFSSESVLTGVWCVPGFGAGFEIALEPSKLQKQAENPGKGRVHFLRQTLVCTKPWFKRDLGFFRCSSGIALHPPNKPCRTCRP